MSDDSTDGRTAVPSPSLRDPMGAIAVLPFVGYLLIPYGGLVAALGWGPYPLVAMGVPELALGTGWVLALRADRSRLLGSDEWAPGRWWYPVGLIVGGTVLAAPLLAAAYFRWRRRNAGSPDRAWLRFAAATVGWPRSYASASA